ncbi:MAG: hypothetical protein HUJ27_07220 [Rhodobacteraceae bacterium]|nr:hypothetical protein [Paracoccaceae bacterium]
MAQRAGQPEKFNVMVVGQRGRVGFEALLFAASFRRFNPDFPGRLIVAEPQPGPLWPSDPRMPEFLRDALADFGAEVVPFESRLFGHAYPHGNKIEGLAALPEGESFLFLDSDTLVTGDLGKIPFDFNRPSASMRRSNTWPVIELYGPGYTKTWKALYDRFGLEFETSLDLSKPDEYWERYLYFNAGWFFGPCPRKFGQRFAEYAASIRDDPPPELVCQPLYPWLDQIALPLVIHALGGGRPDARLRVLDGGAACHYRAIPLLYAWGSDAQVDLLEEITAPNKLKKVLKEHEPFKRMIYQGRGRKARALFDRNALPRREQAIRNTLKRNGFWMR